MTSDPDPDNAKPFPDRWTLIRDIAVLQVKLVFDGLRDLFLVPVSLLIGVVSLVKDGDRPGSEFYDLMHLGKRSEQWINLFGAAEHVDVPTVENDPFSRHDIDSMVKRVESFVVEEYKTGGLTAQAKERLDTVLDAARRKQRRKKRPEA